MNDPRMKPITVYTLMEINLPVDGNDPMLLQSRAIEAAQVAAAPQELQRPQGRVSRESSTSARARPSMPTAPSCRPR